MKKLIKYILLLFIITTNTSPQSISDSLAKSFIESLINDSIELEKFVLPSELKLSNRLGISYPDSKNKFLISNDIESSVKISLQNKSLKYEYIIELLSNDYSILKFQVPSKNIKKEYYFYKSNLISKPFYFAKDWIKQKSKFFEFHISEPSLFNDYSINKLDSFVGEILNLLKFNESEINKLKEEKILYFLCKDENEIELLTDYKTRGLYYLPYDYVISTFNCHYHEILHLLMNYKLQRVNLYTLPLLQEGFAVAFGGRGGTEPNVILEMGLFLAQSNFLNYNSLLDKSDFYQFDASLSYPISGLYTKFLIQSLGIKRFIELYKKYSCEITQINQLKIDTSELPSNSEWQKYLNNCEINNSISVSEFEEMHFQSSLIETEDYCIYENSDDYLFKLTGVIGIKPKELFLNFTSKLFNELFPEKTYQNQKYIITVNADEVSVYNLYSNNLIAKFVKDFSIKNESVTQKGGFFIFTIKKKIFDEPINTLIVDRLGT